MNFSLNVPILFLIFNRPDTTQLIFNEIRKQKPKKLYVAADGYRQHRDGERELCILAREVIKQVDWECEVRTLFRDVNLGCGKAVSTAITWFFENEEEGIILEDDCLPNASFFRFSQEMLEKYRFDDHVCAVSGNYFLDQKLPNDEDYYFSTYNHIWGWATWRRAWAKYDLSIKDWKSVKKQKILEEIFKDHQESNYWKKIFERCYRGEIDTWDYQWTYACWVNSSFCIMPGVNLVQNIGFDNRATHTTVDTGLSIKTKELNFPLKHPVIVERNFQLDTLTWVMHYKPLDFGLRLKNKFFKIFFSKNAS